MSKPPQPSTEPVIPNYSHSEIMLIMSALMLVMLLAALDQTIVSTALPRIATELHNERQLQRFLAQPQISIVIPSIATTAHYARLQLLCQQHGKALSQNDIWIAALADETNDTLVTFDKDFAVFIEIFRNKLIILN